MFKCKYVGSPLSWFYVSALKMFNNLLHLAKLGDTDVKRTGKQILQADSWLKFLYVINKSHCQVNRASK